MINHKKRLTRGGTKAPAITRLCASILIACWVFVMGVSGVYGPVSTVRAEEGSKPGNLYAQSAVLMDADSGRILFSKNGQQERAMASTTKIMTCIVALEYGDLDKKVMASSNAASQPKVHLGVSQGEEFYLRDLLYSLMLESHNDSAVMIAESIGTSVEGFADMMNEKAKELHCKNTYFITPNGLDAKDEKGTHHTTAEDLARIMKYCIADSPQRDMFLEITRTPSYKFSDCQGLRSYSCANHNAFLQMMEGALSGKTGFTGDAGYCYIGALKRDNRTFIVSLLACGWPNNKSYKWSDTKKLMNYGLENYQYQKVWQEINPGTVKVKGGIDNNHPFHTSASLPLEIAGADPDWSMLLGKDEQVEMKWKTEKTVQAPVEKGQKMGEIEYTLHGEALRSFDITAQSGIQKKTLGWYMKTIFNMYTLKNINQSD